MVANYLEYVASTSSVSVLLGKGDGTFAAKTDYPVGDGAYALALGDVDGDGDLDIVTANDQAGTVSVLLGKGDGTFAAKADYPTGSGPRAPMIGDFDGDGKADLAVFNRKAGTVSVLLGKGDGTFAAKVDTVTLGDATSAMASAAAGDLNADGKLDLVVATYLGSVSVLLGKGDGTFTASLESTGVEYLSTTALIDVDGDHKLDLVLTVTYAGAVSIQLGKGDGTFAAPRDYPASGFMTAAVLGDLNGDGGLDIAMSNVDSGSSNGNTVSVLLGTGAGSFATSLEYPAGGPVVAQALWDLNGDGRAGPRDVGREPEHRARAARDGGGRVRRRRGLPARDGDEIERSGRDRGRRRERRRQAGHRHHRPELQHPLRAGGDGRWHLQRAQDLPDGSHSVRAGAGGRERRRQAGHRDRQLRGGGQRATARLACCWATARGTSRPA